MRTVNHACCRSFHGHNGSVEHVACDGEIIVSGGSDRLITAIMVGRFGGTESLAGLVFYILQIHNFPTVILWYQETLWLLYFKFVQSHQSLGCAFWEDSTYTEWPHGWNWGTYYLIWQQAQLVCPMPFILSVSVVGWRRDCSHFRIVGLYSESLGCWCGNL